MKLETRREDSDLAALRCIPGRAFLLSTLLVFGAEPSSVAFAMAPDNPVPAAISVPAALNLNCYGAFACNILWRPDGTGLAASVVADTQQMNSQVLLWGLKAVDPPPRMTAGRADVLTRWLDNDTVEFIFRAYTDRPSPSLYKTLKWSSKTMDGAIQGPVPRNMGGEKANLNGGKWVAYIDYDDKRIDYPLVVKEVGSGRELFRSPKDASVFEFGVCESKGYIVYGANLPRSHELHRVTISDWKNDKVGESPDYYGGVAIRSSNGDFAVGTGKFARQPGIWIYRADGSLKSVSPAELGADCPSWSPDGRLIAFAARGREIRVINGDPMSADDWNTRPSTNWRLAPPAGRAMIENVKPPVQSK